MRRALVKTLVDLAAADPRVLLLTGDLGFMALEPFAERFPDRFFNVGVAEQNMVGLATGLAEAGYVPFVYSIATFASLRAYEFIRNGPLAHDLPVRIVGVGGGFDYGPQGLTHHALEDVGVMRIQPGMTVIAPADHRQLAAALRATWNLPGPIYYRLGKDDTTVVPDLDGRFELGRVSWIRRGREIAILAAGSVASEAAAAAETLAHRGLSVACGIVASLRPAPIEDLRTALEQVPMALTVEAHYVVGGLGSLVAEVVADSALRCRVVRCGVHDPPDGTSGSQRHLEQVHGLSRDALVDTALRVLRTGER